MVDVKLRTDSGSIFLSAVLLALERKRYVSDAHAYRYAHQECQDSFSQILRLTYVMA